MRQLAGKRALVTGAASGIGRALARQLAQQRCRLYLLDINEVGLEQVASDLRSQGTEVVTQHCDMASSEAIDAAAEQALEQWAGVDVLVNNAGITYYGYTHEMADEHWDQLLLVNLLGPGRLTRALLPSLIARPEAHILNVCSVLGLVGMPRVGAYCTSKFGMVGFSETLRAEYGRCGLGVTALCPGFVKTNLFSSAEPRPGAGTKSPPAMICTTPERVAKVGIRAIRRNQAIVRAEPFSRVLYGLRQNFPTTLDWLLRFGRRKRVLKKQAELAKLSADPTEALRLTLQQGQQALAERRAA